MSKFQRVTGETRKVEKILKQHFPDYPEEFPPKAYRYNIASIRVGLVDRCFQGMNLVERHNLVLPVLRTLPEKTQTDIMLVLLLTPEEVAESSGNLEFENPQPLSLPNGRLKTRTEVRNVASR